MFSHGQIWWNELTTRNAGRAMEFYGNAFDWTFDAMPTETGDTYWLCKSGDDVVAGILTMQEPYFDDIPDHWFTYFAVDDIDIRIEEALAAGGTLRRPAFEVPGIGRIAIVADPNGAVSGWMTPASQRK
ncbi:VOC family protein [Hoeflea sp. TYP-13]|uniref:VOC family protein n=1 Tax=Hoeflea sp. TYP-13 TaxID=3230023 RepID=UPI0034C69ADE